MYAITRLCQIRELELFLFGGLPDPPEAVYERDNHCFSEDRAGSGRGRQARTTREFHTPNRRFHVRFDPVRRQLIVEAHSQQG